MTNKHDFPDFFTTRGPIQTNVVPLRFGNNIYWMSSIAKDEDSDSFQRPYLRPYDDNEEGLLDCGDVEENYDILLTKSGKFMTSFYVPSGLLSFIIGPKGSKLKNLQRSTNTLIKVPKPNEKGDVKITGETERKVASARTQISMIVMQRKDRLPFSHFVCIPVLSDAINENLRKFQEEVLKQDLRGVSPSIFQKPGKLHLTICILTLVDDEEVATAKNVLQSCYEEVISNIFEKGKKRKIHVQGLEIMNDDPSEVNVLYANVQLENDRESEKLQEVADKIAEHFYRAGLARRQYDRVKLHLTLMNTSFRSSVEKRENFDATYILENFKGYRFGAVDFDNLQLSIRGTSGENKFYDSALTISI